ncbi:2-amino-4-hydroxy-6-hydroxymethyldihydropteridine diphosphokinase [Yoonia sp. 2307UL14-13]|uniref:2-amino-4-hydroxy-6- hydroxymethyldihydropteridine diphosphokinase n=1 Tax=Yoonia sp. 2307UL14-13 TaxID=3126506 RepID=UPI0030971174
MADNGRQALILLGSNKISPLGDVEETVQRAMELLANSATGPAKYSGLYRTPAFPPGAGPDFVNAAIAFRTPRDAPALLEELHRIEAAAGRVRTTRWAPRTLDLDLIALGVQVHPDVETQTTWRDKSPEQQQSQTPDQLILPHPRLQDRAFALVPLADVAPDWMHPILNRTIAQMLSDRPAAERAEVTPLNHAPENL